ncbi:unnamed protein product [Didymodactylos carnosus]|uniref:G-protein coupled receptors family 1 profile domain-containing protein n=1 Tax=Didymodactylos carnosus TaxID=1234261 RepID=A0A815D5W1_9BILA|nr:unnamed protein product [Didymodactylos carnosus]CAF1289213.1 unnamed protein product [Didymodactylos carnosus]CAF3730097.1 unnamed protein product [Didymodactylos carnosus]CAF4093695.1 unnamed protein product [Didymodactylos carnosus]
MSYSNNTTITVTLYEAPLLRHIKLCLLLIFQIPSVLCTLLIFYHFLKNNREYRHRIQNQILVLLLFINFLIETIELTITETFLNFGFIQSSKICLFWITINYTLFALSLSLTAWTSIERYLFIFNAHFIKKHLILLHYLPIIMLIIYTPLFYSGLILIYQCENDFDCTKYTCAGPCYLYEAQLGITDWLINVFTPIIIIAVTNVTLIVQVIKQKYRMQRTNQWRRTIKLSIQLLSISFLYICGWFPYMTVSLIQIFENTLFLTHLVSTYVAYLAYVSALLLPFVSIICLPDIKQNLLSLLFNNNIIHAATTRTINKTIAHTVAKF